MTPREIERRIEELERRVRELEARPPILVIPGAPVFVPTLPMPSYPSYPMLPASPEFPGITPHYPPGWPTVTC